LGVPVFPETSAGALQRWDRADWRCGEIYQVAVNAHQIQVATE